MSEFPRVSIIIVNWNGTGDTIQCIDSVLKIDYPQYDVIIVDNGSISAELQLLKDRLSNSPIIKIIELKRNLGFAIANNVGIRIAIHNGASFALLLNNDTIVHPNFLKELVLAAGSDGRKGILGPRMYYHPDKEGRLWYAGGKLNMYFGHKAERGPQKHYQAPKRTDFVAGACILIRKDVFDSVGLLPREYFLGWEDIDFCYAARRSGFDCVFVPTSEIWHKASASYKRGDLSYAQVFFGFRNRIIMRYKFLSKSKFGFFC